ncbi:MAG: BMP family ABC transporter substrate-binding protein, partial [Candidatus Heimdallarchaeota archaeon]|nr:BMP family ABC transporter substrate-binding protein [Candidatus Heimdallarchaeota archaeon]
VIDSKSVTLQGAGESTVIRPSGPGTLSSFYTYPSDTSLCPNLTVAEYEPVDGLDLSSAIENFAITGSYDLIIAVGFEAVTALQTSAENHPLQNFTIIDAYVGLPNVASLVVNEQEGSFLAGAMAAMVSQTGILGFLGGRDIDLINRFKHGYIQGAYYINNSITVQVAYTPDLSNPFGDVIGGQAVTEEFIANGADVIYAAAGRAGLGVFDAVTNTELIGEIYAIGVDSDQDSISPGYILTSMMKRYDNVLESHLQAQLEGNWVKGFQNLGLAENAVSLSNMTQTQLEANANFTNGKTRLEVIEDLKQAIINGSIVVSSSSSPDVQAIDFTPPRLNSPDDFNYEVGSTGNEIVWNVGDINVGHYNVTKDGSVHVSDTPWSNGVITMNVDGLDPGIYTFIINVYDADSNVVTDSVIISVVDSQAPEISSPDDITYEIGSTGNQIIWTVADLYPDVYNVTENGSLAVSDVMWSSGVITLNIDGLDIGLHDFTINLYDSSGNMISDSVNVIVIEIVATTTPEISTSDVTTTPEDSTSTDDTTSDPVTTTNVVTPDTSIETSAPFVPGFGLSVTLMSFFMVLVIYSKKTRSETS